MSQIVIEPDGTLRALYDDGVAEALRGLGALDVRRASHIEFDNAVQGWFVDMLADGRLGIVPFRAGPFLTHGEAVAWEARYLDGRLAGLGDDEACVWAGRIEEKKQ